MGGRRQKKALIVFLKYPETGKVKTRLAAEIGSGEALRLYAILARRSLGIASDLIEERSDIDGIIFYDPPDRRQSVIEIYPGPWRFIAQRGKDLGERMRNAFDTAFGLGYGQAVLIGSDIADLDLGDIRKAFDALAEGKTPVGAARDGGYYMIGLGRPCPKAFNLVEWSTSYVFQETLKNLNMDGHRTVVLSERRDVDRREDAEFLLEKSFVRDCITVIIPFLESDTDQAVALAERLHVLIWPDDEIILVKGLDDHGGNQGCRHVNEKIRMICGTRGRGAQLNQGASQALGTIVWFLHADSVPPANFGYHIRKLTIGSEFSFGCFRLAFSEESPELRLIARWANARTRYLRLPYGDQGIFCRLGSFNSMGGFRKRLIMEDVEMALAFRKYGKLLFAPETIVTSGRRYLKGGVVRTALMNHLTMMMYIAGVSDETLYRFYYRSPHG